MLCGSKHTNFMVSPLIDAIEPTEYNSMPGEKCQYLEIDGFCLLLILIANFAKKDPGRLGRLGSALVSASAWRSESAPCWEFRICDGSVF